MKVAKVLCRCGKQAAYIKDLSTNEAYQKREFDLLAKEGFVIMVGENLEPSEPCLHPCQRTDCALSRRFSTSPGFNNLYDQAKNC